MASPCAQISRLTRLRDLRLRVREIDADGVVSLQTLSDLRSLDLEVRLFPLLGLLCVGRSVVLMHAALVPQPISGPSSSSCATWRG